MDLSINIEDYKLNIRVAAIIIHNNKLLVHSNKNDNYYALLGGRIQIGENSEKALKREMLEEMGKEIEITEYIATIENFFESKGEKYHEIQFVYKAEFEKEEDKKIEYTIKNVEGENDLEYNWIDLKEIDSCPIKPQVIKEILKQNKYPVHKINDDAEIEKTK